MRVLFTTLMGTGHFHPLVPLAKALQNAGHEVGFTAPPASRELVEHSGFRFFPAGGEVEFGQTHFADFLKMQKEMMRTNPAAFFELVPRMFAGRISGPMVPDMLEAAKSWRPDLIIRNVLEFGGCVVAERLGLPHVSLQVSGIRPGDIASDSLTDALNELRQKAALPPDPSRQMPYRYQHLSLLPPSFFQGGMPENTTYLRTETFEQSGAEGLPEWAARLGKRPVVYLTFGTVANRLLPVLGSLVEALRDEPLELVVTVGRDQDPAQLGPQPAHVHVERYIPQGALMPHCDVAVMHGGYSSVTSVLMHGRPLVLVPLGTDQPMNALRCRELGAAEVLDVDALSPELIRDSVRKVLREPSYREAAQRFQREALALPRLEHGVALLERLVERVRPDTGRG